MFNYKMEIDCDRCENEMKCSKCGRGENEMKCSKCSRGEILYICGVSVTD